MTTSDILKQFPSLSMTREQYDAHVKKMGEEQQRRQQEVEQVVDQGLVTQIADPNRGSK